MAEDGFTLAWEGLKGLKEALDKTIEGADEAAREIVAKSAAVAENAAKANFSGAHKKGQPRVGGAQPNIVTGNLRRSIRSDPITKTGLGEYGTRVAPRALYARRVELGYRGSTAYPFFTPAARESQPKFEAIAAEVWRKFLTA